MVNVKLKRDGGKKLVGKGVNFRIKQNEEDVFEKGKKKKM